MTSFVTRRIVRYTSSSSSADGSTRCHSAKDRILGAAFKSVPAHGFTKDALTIGAKLAGFPPTSLALLPRGVFDLVMFHLVKERARLKETSLDLQPRKLSVDSTRDVLVASNIEQYVLRRLRANTPIIHQYGNAIAIMSLARNIPASIAELGRLSDEILYLAGDTSVDTTWYFKRCALAGIYAASETFMTQDQSTNFIDTERFVHRRLEDGKVLAQSAADLGQFINFAGISTINILRSRNLRI